MYFLGAVSTTFRAPFSTIILERWQKSLWLISPKLGNPHQNNLDQQIALGVRGEIWSLILGWTAPLKRLLFRGFKLTSWLFSLEKNAEDIHKDWLSHNWQMIRIGFDRLLFILTVITVTLYYVSMGILAIGQKITKNVFMCMVLVCLCWLCGKTLFISIENCFFYF